MTTQHETADFLSQLLDTISVEEQNRIDNRMLLAARIADAMKAQKINQKQLAVKMGKSHSVITKWLSGTHNFTIDTLSDLEVVLNISLLKTKKEQPANYFVNFSVNAPYKRDYGYNSHRYSTKSELNCSVLN